jgi:hypothetical protein
MTLWGAVLEAEGALRVLRQACWSVLEEGRGCMHRSAVTPVFMMKALFLPAQLT